MDSKYLASKTKDILKSMGYEVQQSHCYELLARLSGFKSWHVAKSTFEKTFKPTKTEIEAFIKALDILMLKYKSSNDEGDEWDIVAVEDILLQTIITANSLTILESALRSTSLDKMDNPHFATICLRNVICRHKHQMILIESIVGHMITELSYVSPISSDIITRFDEAFGRALSGIGVDDEGDQYDDSLEIFIKYYPYCSDKEYLDSLILKLYKVDLHQFMVEFSEEEV